MPDKDASMEDLEDFLDLARAAGIIAEVMRGQDKEFSIPLMVALRDWISDAYNEDDFGFEIAAQVASGKV